MPNIPVNTPPSFQSPTQANKLPPSFYCPISLQRMEEPVIASDGYTYDRCSIQQHIEYCQRQGKAVTSPITRQPLQVDALVPNRALRELMESTFNQPNVQQAASNDAAPSASHCAAGASSSLSPSSDGFIKLAHDGANGPSAPPLPQPNLQQPATAGLGPLGMSSSTGANSLYQQSINGFIKPAHGASGPSAPPLPAPCNDYIISMPNQHIVASAPPFLLPLAGNGNNATNGLSAAYPYPLPGAMEAMPPVSITANAPQEPIAITITPATTANNAANAAAQAYAPRQCGCLSCKATCTIISLIVITGTVGLTIMGIVKAAQRYNDV